MPYVHELREFAPPQHLLVHGRLNGFGMPEDHIARAVELGIPAVAMTEHGNVSSHVKHEQAALKAGIKPVFGCELYTGAVDPEGRSNFKWHLTVLAENEVGYQNLMRLVSRGWAEGFYFEPTVSGEMLADHSEGLIVLSGCTGSKMSTDLLGGKGRPEHKADLAEAERTARKFKALFGDRFFLEVQAFPELDKVLAINESWERLSAKLDIPLVATGDVHYPKPDDNHMQVILHAAGRGSTVEKQQMGWGYDIPLSDPLSDKEILRRVRGTGLSLANAQSAIENSTIIADWCNVTLPKADRLRFPVPSNTPTVEYTWAKLREGWKYRGFGKLSKDDQKAYYERLTYEMSVIVEKDFCDYFLMLSDLVSQAKDRGIPVGPARGSAAASLTCYLLRITEVNPMHFPTMFFERFIDLNRMDIPDVDLDFDDERRKEMWDLARERYGDDRVGTIGTYTRYRGKNALQDVGWVHKVPRHEVETVKGLVIERSGGDSRFDASLEDTIGMFPQAADVFDRYPEMKYAIELEGNLRGMGVHAAGMVIANSPITDICAMYTRTNKDTGEIVSVLSVDKYDAEYLGLMKADFLGLRTMGMIRLALEFSGLTLDDLYAIQIDEPDTLKAFRVNDVVGIFQFEGRATRLVNRDVEPDHFMHLSDINALSRPGPLFSGTTHEYIQVKHGRKEPDHMHPAVDAITSFSNYQIIYQEQILQIVREVGGFPWTHASAIRKIISQKKGEAAFNEMYGMFVEGAERLHGIDERLAERIWKKLVTSGTYAFNVAHSVSYSLLAFWCMWLKVHYPVEFYTAQLRKTDDAKWARILRDADQHGIRILPPDRNLSGITWSVNKDDNSILAGLSQVKGIGAKTAQTIIDSRDERGDFAEWRDLQRVKGIGPKTIISITDAVDNPDPFGINKTRDALAIVRDAIATGELGLPEPTHNSEQLLAETNSNLRLTYLGVVKAREYQDFIENKRARSGDSVEEIKAAMKRPDLTQYCALTMMDEGEEEVYLRISRFAFPRMKEMLVSIREGVDVIYAIGKKNTQVFGISIMVDNLVVIDPEDEEEDDEPE